ncbi:MAG: hypothetical protein ABI810_19355, partial [Sphingomonas bacterium]
MMPEHEPFSEAEHSDICHPPGMTSHTDVAARGGALASQARRMHMKREDLSIVAALIGVSKALGGNMVLA